jgi:hypothetical protein
VPASGKAADVPTVAMLVAASPTPAFYSQVAMLDLSLRERRWTRWRPAIHVYLGGRRDPAADARWLPRLDGVELHWTADSDFARDGDWAQSDDVFRRAPEDADVLVAMDADTLAVADLEDVLDAVLAAGSVAGVIAHYPPRINPQLPCQSLREVWARLAEGLTDARLSFAFEHTLVDAGALVEHRLTPFYLNFGVVFFSRAILRPVAQRYLAFRSTLMQRLSNPDLSGQVSLALAIADAGVPIWSLPIRYNFPNDPIAEGMYPDELSSVVIYHYLRTAAFNRHEIFADATRYAQFLGAPLSGVNERFRDAVRQIAGQAYPFA